MKRKSLYKTCLLIIALFITGNLFAQDTLRVLSYNILEGMKTDTTKGKTVFVNWIKKQNPDILALQECNKFTEESLNQLARSFGHPYSIIVKLKGYPVGLTSKYPILNAERINENMTHGFIVANVLKYNILVAHLNPHNYEKRREEIGIILQKIKDSNQKKNWIMMGDLNSLSPLDRNNYADGVYLNRLIENEKKHANHHNLEDGKYLDFEVQQKILDFGLIDAMKSLPTGNDFKSTRIDYIYLSKNLRSGLEYCKFIYDDFTKKHSDHRPILMKLSK